MAAEPAIEKRVEKMVSNHRWVPAGYKVCCTAIPFSSELIPSTGEVWRSVPAIGALLVAEPW